jgi:cytochrome c peroxidase
MGTSPNWLDRPQDAKLRRHCRGGSAFYHEGRAPSTFPRGEEVEAAKPVDPRKVELGKKLFFAPRLSKSGFLSRNSRHNGPAVGEPLASVENRVVLRL